MQYFQQALPHLADDAVLVVDDIGWSPGMRRAWTEIENHPRVRVAVDLQALGVAVLGKGSGVAEKFSARLA